MTPATLDTLIAEADKHILPMLRDLNHERPRSGPRSEWASQRTVTRAAYYRARYTANAERRRKQASDRRQRLIFDAGGAGMCR